MLKDQVRDITILYDVEDSDVIEAVKLVVERNYQVFLHALKGKKTISLFEIDDPDVYEMYDFEVEFYRMLKSFIECEDIKDILENASLLDWYLYYFASNDNNVSTNVDIGYDLKGKDLDEIFNLLIRYRYYQEHHDLDNFPKYHLSGRDADKVFDWLQDKLRFPIYNELIKMMINEISMDKYVYKNLGLLYLLLVDEIKKDVDKNLVNKLPKMNINEIDKLMYEFLDFIHAPKSWYDKYNEVKVKDRLKLFREIDVPEDDKYTKTSFIYEDDIPKIQLVLTGRIDDFTAFVHELVHYISPIGSSDFSRFVIRELPSIYFELIAAFFLVKKGYTKKIIKYVYQIHHLDNAICSFNYSILLYRILDYIQNGEDSLDKEINDVLSQGERSIRLDTSDYFSDDVLEVEQDIKDCIDDINKRLLNNGIISLSGIQYVLAMNIIDNINLEEALPKMIDIVQNIDNYDLESVLRLFDRDIFNDLEKNKIKILTKK